MANQVSKISFACGMAYLKRACSFMGGMRGKFWLGTLLASLELLIAYITPILFQTIIRVFETNQYEGAYSTLIGLGLVSLALTPLIILGNYWKKRGVLEARSHISIALFDKVQKLPLKKLSQHEKGDYVTRIVNDAASAVGPMSGYTFIALMKFVLYTAISMAVLVGTNGQYAVAGLLMSVVAFAVSFVFSPRARYMEQEAKALTAGAASMLMEAVANAPVIRVFALDEKLRNRFDEMCRQISDKRVGFRTANGMIEGVVYLFSACVQPVTFLMGIYLMIQGNLTIATVVYLSGVTGILAEGIRSFSQFVQFIQSSFVSLARVYAVLDMPEEKAEGTRAPEQTETAIRIRNLTFGYHDARILNGVDLCVQKGQTVAIVGQSGCGKSTLMKLIIRLYEPDGGAIEIAGSGETGGNIAYVAQACDIFRGTIRENIGYGRKNATFEEIRRAAQRAGCGEFIEKLPQAYDTIIDENGTNLSGGQKQRIAIARALIKDAPVLVLDEITSAMDALTEENILNEMMEAVRGKTVLMVTHRMNVANRMERIVVMEEGRIIEDGSHEELIAQKGAYYRACQEQAK